MIARKGAYVVVSDDAGATVFRIANRVSGVKLDDVEALEVGLTARTHQATCGSDNGARSGMNGAAAEKTVEAFADDLAERIDTLAEQAGRGVILFAAPGFIEKVRLRLSDKSKAALSAIVERDCRDMRLAELEELVHSLDEHSGGQVH
ncbi:MAG: host attachment protein [Hyphomonadaceae bacterium]